MHSQKKKISIILVFLFLFVAYVGFSAYLFPGQIILMGEKNPIKLPRFFVLSGENIHWEAEHLTLEPGENSLTLNFLGIIPIKKTQIYLLEPTYLRLGGHSVGVVLESDGLKIAGFFPVKLASGNEVWPARDAGLQVNDVIQYADGIKIKDATTLQRLAAEKGEITLTVIRNGWAFETKIYPAESRENGQRERALGIYLAEPVMGVGTLTFATADGRKFAALGHVIGNGETETTGIIQSARIVGILKGERGAPGEKLGLFDSGGGTPLGVIEKNTNLGIYGNLTTPLDSPLVELALYDEIQTGPAEIVTVLEDNKLETFSGNIDQIFARREPTNRSFVIRITDPRLLQETGGIVQGMSGSPILQNGKLIGAITHVFVNDPTRGYGALAEWMALEAGAFRIEEQAYGS
ncbi:MAG: SpoIVB peptidase [Firmicutes bacterium]|nr:SpoIVB peptidase [Bacillota bacterium]MDD4694815.1 SpoIVB peptidase [Bacillota bacterium]